MRTCRLSLQVAAALSLAACQHTEPGIKVVEVEVPVPQPCLTQEQLADFPEPPLIGDQLGRTPETASQDRDLIAGSALRLRIWGKTLFAALEACAD